MAAWKTGLGTIHNKTTHYNQGINGLFFNFQLKTHNFEEHGHVFKLAAVVDSVLATEYD